ncbi:MAG: hypothetical protein JST28_05295 [Acidobacteria bacterium]|nr:hypothetical protein [Acidobacteriota bacterium]
MKQSRLTLSLFLCSFVAGCGGPPGPGIQRYGKGVVVHLETLAEYPTSIDRIVIAKEDKPDEKVLEALSDDGAQIHRLMLHAGKNNFDDIHPYRGTYRMLIPDGRSFTLSQNERYRITVCKTGKCRSAEFILN